MPPNLLRNSVLDDVGNPDAEPGSPAWARWFVLRAKKYRNDLNSDAASLRELIDKLAKHEAWRVLGYASFGMLCQVEVGLTGEELDRLRVVEPGQTVGAVLAPHGGDRKSEAFKEKTEDQGSVTTLNGRRDSDYLTARLTRDAPLLADQVRRGELTPHAAAIQAGFRTRMISVPVDPARAARILVKHLDRAAVEALIAELCLAAGIPFERTTPLDDDAQATRAALADAEKNGTVPWDQVKADLGLEG